MARHVFILILGTLLAACAACDLASRPPAARVGDPATRMADELRRYLRNAKVESIEFRLHDDAEPRLRLTEPDQVASLVTSFVDALAAEDLREGQHRHRSVVYVLIRFIINDGPDVRLNYVSFDMFWATKSDEQPEWKSTWVNLQTPALTKCFASYIAEVWPATQPASRAE